MFARFKRKSDDDEGPLVPHGLVWQATDEPAGEPARDESEVAKPAVFEDNQASSEVVEMPANATPPPQVDPPRKLGAISPPLQWPSSNIQEIARHPEVHVARPTPLPAEEHQVRKERAKPIDNPAVLSTAGPVAVAPPTPKLTSVARERAASWVKLGLGKVRSAALSSGWRVRAVSADAHRAFAALMTGLHDSFQRLNVKGRIVNVRDLVGAQIENWYEKSQSLGAAAAQNLRKWKQAAALSWRSGIQKSVVTAKTIDFGTPARNLLRASNLKLTIRIPHQDFARIAAAISAVRVPWNRARQAVNRDSRLWMSMVMAGLSALLAVGVISTLSRYQPGSSPAVVGAQSPDTATNIKPAELASTPPGVSKAAASSMVQRPSPSLRTQMNAAEKHTEVAAPKPAKPASTKPAPSTRPNRKMHNSEDDDYVAKDTYVVYGRNGKPLR